MVRVTERDLDDDAALAAEMKALRAQRLAELEDRTAVGPPAAA